MAAAGILLVGSMFPNFEANTTIGIIDFHDWLEDSWGILFVYPFDYTPVPTTELKEAVMLDSEFKKRNVKVIALAHDSIEFHNGWIKDIMWYSMVELFPFPIISDISCEVTDMLGFVGDAHSTKSVFIIGPDKKLKLSMYYPDTTGYNFDEILRVVDSLQLTAQTKAATPANWNNGDDYFVPPLLKQMDVVKLFPEVHIMSLPSGKKYMKFRSQPE